MRINEKCRLDSEEALVGKMLFNDEIIPEVKSRVGDYVFRDKLLGKIYDAVIKVNGVGDPLDPWAVVNQVMNDGIDGIFQPGQPNKDRKPTQEQIIKTDVAARVAELALKACNSGEWEPVADALGDLGKKDHTAQVCEAASRACLNGQSSGEILRDLRAGLEPIRETKASVLDRIKSPTELHDSIPDEENYFIDGLLARNETCFIGGREKMLKTSIAFDLAVSLATSTDFLGKFPINGEFHVLIMSGESGDKAHDKLIERIVEARGIKRNHLDGRMRVSNWIPKVCDPKSMDEFEMILDDRPYSVVITDPVYHMFMGVDPGQFSNMMAVGGRLVPFQDTCRKRNITPILIHHFSGPPKRFPELSDLAYAGFKEFARQWILLGRTTPYVDGSGQHDLNVKCGGSIGHDKPLFGVNIDEGQWPNRKWDPQVSEGGEFYDKIKDSKFEAKEAKRLEKDTENMARFKKVLRLAGKNGQTVNGLLQDVGLGRAAVANLVIELRQKGMIEGCEIAKNGRSFSGWRATDKMV